MNPTRASRPLLVSIAGAAAAVATVVTQAPATAATPTAVDCSSPTVRLDQTGADYVLTGACRRVVLTGVDVTVQLTSATRLVIRAPGADVTATERLGTVTTSRIAGAAHLSAPRIRTVEARGATMRLTADRVSTISSVGSYARVKVGSARRVSIDGATSRYRFDRLARLAIRGERTSVVVRKGATRVIDTGDHNRIRVHRRR